MSEFEQWFGSLNANEKTVYFLGNEHKVSEMAWNHQQAKIDELQLKNAELARIMLDKNREIVKQAMQIDELQKRIDDALSICNTSSFPLITWIDRALRGGHENSN